MLTNSMPSFMRCNTPLPPCLRTSSRKNWNGGLPMQFRVTIMPITTSPMMQAGEFTNHQARTWNGFLESHSLSKIGRASCRERVEIAVEDGGCKDKRSVMEV